MRKKGTKNKVYSPELKITVVEDMQENRLSYHEIMRKYFPEMPDRNFKFIKVWERIYLEEGVAGLMEERRGRSSKIDGVKKGRPPKLKPEVEEDLIAENQRLRMENAYLKKLHALALSKKKLRSETTPK